MTRAAVVLSGGGIKSAAHIGVMRALGEAGIVAATFTGTSGGAIVAAALAAGVGYDELLAHLPGLSGRQVVRPDRRALLLGWRLRSLLQARPLRHAIERIVPIRAFDEVRTPLRVTAVDVESGELAVFGTGARSAPLVDVLCASCALPMYYPPVEIAGRRYGDGGLRGVLPLWSADTSNCDLVLAVDIGPGFGDEPPAAPSRLPAMVQAADEAQGILMAALTESQVARWRLESGRAPLVLVRPPSRVGDTFVVDRIPYYLEAGHRAAVEALDRWRSAPGRGAGP